MGEGNVFSLFTSGGGGVPISHNALQHYPECHGAARGGGVPCQVQRGGGVPWPGGYPGGYPGGGTQLGQHREYLLHGGRYASCVHAGGLSCCEQLFTLPFQGPLHPTIPFGDIDNKDFYNVLNHIIFL